jgi:predicted DNA-binding transcriptional regulator
MISVSNVYENIRITNLARILQLDERSAEKLAAKMIIDGTLTGFIDQEGWIDDIMTY